PPFLDRRMTMDLYRWDLFLIAQVVPRPMTVAPVDPCHHCIFLEFAVPFLKDCAERIEVPFDLNEVLLGDSRPLCLERRLELFPELSELLLIHADSLVRCVRPPLLSVKARLASWQRAHCGDQA